MHQSAPAEELKGHSLNAASALAEAVQTERLCGPVAFQPLGIRLHGVTGADLAVVTASSLLCEWGLFQAACILYQTH